MPKRIKLRTMSSEEEAAIRKLAHARKESVEVVRRARLLEYLLDHPAVPASQAGQVVGFVGRGSGIEWVKRFNEKGIAGLSNRAKSGRPVTHTEALRSQVIALAVQKPQTLGYPFALWTLRRLQAAVAERHQLHISASTIWEWLDAEGLEWKRQASWFRDAEKHDAEFVEKRGSSSGPM